MTDRADPDRRSDLGRAVAEQFQLQRLHRESDRAAALPRVGALAQKITRFGLLTGRSLLTRRAVGAVSSIGPAATSSLPMSVPHAELWLPYLHRYHSAIASTVFAGDEASPPHEAPVVLGGRGLPRATALGRHSPVGAETGPAALSHRSVSSTTPVNTPAEVRAVGPVILERERARLLGRTNTGPPSPPAGGGWARRSAQATRPERSESARVARVASPEAPESTQGAPAAGVEATEATRGAGVAGAEAPESAVVVSETGLGPPASARGVPVADAEAPESAGAVPETGLGPSESVRAAQAPGPGPDPSARAARPPATAAPALVLRRAIADALASASARIAADTRRAAIRADDAVTGPAPVAIGGSPVGGVSPSRRPASKLGWEAAAARPVVGGAGRVGDGGLLAPRLGSDAAVRRPVVAQRRGGWTPAGAAPVPAIWRPAGLGRVARETGNVEAAPAWSPSRAPGPRPALPSFQDVARAVAAETMSDVRPFLALDRALAVRRSGGGGAVGAATGRPAEAPSAVDPNIGATRTGPESVGGVTPSLPAVVQRTATSAPVSAGPLAVSTLAGRRVSDDSSAGAPREPSADVSRFAAPESRSTRAADTVEPRSVAARLRPAGATVTGTRFLAALASRPVDPVTPLPPPFTPLARAIAGDRPVAMRSGPATTRALTTVGKAAATVDNVIHLAPPTAATPPSPEVIAHELVHAARPSPIPRFFEDDHGSPEEDVARSTGRLIRAFTPPSDATEASGRRGRETAGLAVGGGVGPGILGLLSTGSGPVIRRKQTTPLTTTSSTSSSTSSLSTSSTGASDSSGRASTTAVSSTPSDFTGSPAVEAQPGPTPDTIASSVIASNGGSAGDESSVSMLRRLMGQIDVSETQSVQARSSMWSVLNAGPSPTPPQVGSSTTPSTNELIERIIEALEDRVIDELERRGRRNNPGVF